MLSNLTFSEITKLTFYNTDVGRITTQLEPQEEGMMTKAANFSSVRNQGLSNPGKSQTPEGDAC
jgi:hypothetical protein